MISAKENVKVCISFWLRILYIFVIAALSISIIHGWVHFTWRKIIGFNLQTTCIPVGKLFSRANNHAEEHFRIFMLKRKAIPGVLSLFFITLSSHAIIFLSTFVTRRQETFTIPLEISVNVGAKTCLTTGECTQSRFRSVAEISSDGEKLSTLALIDVVIALVLFPCILGVGLICLLKSMLSLQDRALKGFAAQERSSGLAVDSSDASRGPITAGDFCCQGISLCKKAPIDLTLKTIVRFASSSPLHWWVWWYVPLLWFLVNLNLI